jgi:subtilisin family serine protease
MAPGASDPRELETAQRLRDQLAQFNSGEVAWDADPPEGPGLLYVPDQVLVETGRVADVVDVINSRNDIFVGAGGDADEPLEGLSRVPLPGSVNNNDQPDVLEAVKVFDEDIGPGVVTPNHILHLTGDGHSRICPANEPEETGLIAHWPPENTRAGAGKSVRVAVVDTGEYPLGANPQPHPGPLGVYDGHARFVAHVLHDRAPQATIEHEWVPMPGGGLDEVRMAQAILRLVGPQRPKRERPHVVNLSAGCYTYNNQGLAAFRHLRRVAFMNQDIVLVAAAGNDGAARDFYPAAFGWVVGVGSLDHNNKVSSFSNYGRSADVYALGRNMINVYPYGRYVCQEAPNKGDVRKFDNGLARWSGTSFSSPLVAGLIAARMSFDKKGARAAKNAVIADARQGSDPVHGKFRYLPRPAYLPAYPKPPPGGGP